MQLFPTKNYTIELKDSPVKSIGLLKLNTMLSDSLSTQTTDKKFIGRINGNRFEIISSEIGIGAFTVLQGNFSDDSVTLVAEVNKPFKILISILSILALGGISYNAFKIGFPGGFGMLVPLLMFLGLLRFVFLGSFFERSFRLVFWKIHRLITGKTNSD